MSRDRELGYISMPHFRPFLPCIFLRISRNPHFIMFLGDQRGGQDISACHIPEYPFFGHQNVEIGTVPTKIISGGGQDTPACHILCCSFHAFCLECLETSLDGQTDGQKNGHRRDEFYLKLRHVFCWKMWQNWTCMYELMTIIGTNLQIEYPFG